MAAKLSINMYEDGIVPHMEEVRTYVRPSVQHATTYVRRKRPGSRRGFSSDDSHTHLLISVKRDVWWSDWLRVSVWFGVYVYDTSFIAACVLSSLNDQYAFGRANTIHSFIIIKSIKMYL